jgi:membrane protein DedA with SNARE-associated domain
LALIALGIALLAWVVLGGLLLFALLMVLGLESGNHPEHSAELTRLAGVWLAGTLLGVVAIVVIRRATSPKGP